MAPLVGGPAAKGATAGVLAASLTSGSLTSNPRRMAREAGSLGSRFATGGDWLATGSDRFAIGVVLPLSGPPALSAFAEQIQQGIELAIAEHGAGDVDIMVRNYRADPLTAALQTQQLDRAGVRGIVGYLDEESLSTAARYRNRLLPLVSPTARNADAAGPGVYSLEGPDPVSARKIARFASGRGYLRVGIVHSRAPESAAEARAFEEEAQSLGLPVAISAAYDVGTANFGEPLKAVIDALRAAEIAALELGEEDTLDADLLDPVGLYVAAPIEDIELLAPQVTHYGFDTLAIGILGNSAWTHPTTLSVVDTRHTTGVVAPSGEHPDAELADSLFRSRYEQHFARSLVSPVPALGYDATLVLLAAISAGERPHALRISGVTGVFGLDEGRILRNTRIVEVWQGGFVEPGATEAEEAVDTLGAAVDTLGAVVDTSDVDTSTVARFGRIR